MSQPEKSELCAALVEAAHAILDATGKFRAWSAMEPPVSWWNAFDRCVDTLRDAGEYIVADELLLAAKAKSR